jgi:hypothetical protein
LFFFLFFFVFSNKIKIIIIKSKKKKRKTHKLEIGNKESRNLQKQVQAVFSK